MKDKKAQVKIQQMAFMLLAITLFFVLVAMLVLVFKSSSIKESATVLNEKNALLLSTKIANSPEFSCGESFDQPMTNCVDGDKVMMLKELSGRYDGFWGRVPNIKIETVYPVKNKIECTKGSYPNCNVIDLYQKDEGFYQPNFVSLCKKVRTAEGTINKCELAKIYVGYPKEQA